MKQPLHLAVECLMAAKERPVDPADLDGSRSALCSAPHKADYVDPEEATMASSPHLLVEREAANQNSDNAICPD
jgi:hypothetical protein